MFDSDINLNLFANSSHRMVKLERVNTEKVEILVKVQVELTNENKLKKSFKSFHAMFLSFFKIGTRNSGTARFFFGHY